MRKDIWHYPRHTLANQILNMFESGLSSALIFFAPRRMGKTQFLLKDIRPLAQKRKWHVLYHSFLDSSQNAQENFTLALIKFAAESGVIKSETPSSRIKKLAAGAGTLQASVEFHNPQSIKLTLKELIDALSTLKKPTLLLLDEVQVLAQAKANRDFVAALRTALDTNKDKIKIIFTGSSQAGLRRMFSKSDAPFFHFGQNLPFPEFDRGFINHLACLFYRITQKILDEEALWQAFLRLSKVPQLIRSLVEQLVLDPSLNIKQAQKQLLVSIIDDREYKTYWENSRPLERLLLNAIASKQNGLFSKKNCSNFSKHLNKNVGVSTIQSAIRSLKHERLIVSGEERGSYHIDDPNFKHWLIRRMRQGQA